LAAFQLMSTMAPTLGGRPGPLAKRLETRGPPHQRRQDDTLHSLGERRAP
jgi:hypothetical protein